MTDTANAPERLVVIWTIADEDTMPATVSAHTPKSRDFERGAPRWMEGKRLEYVLATHCDELVAAAYLDAGWKPIQTAPRDGSWFVACAVSPEFSVAKVVHFDDEHDRFPITGLRDEAWARAPTHWMPLPESAPAPDDARAALTAYGERMKAEGAREAQAKIARLTEALKAEHAYWVKCADADWAEQDLHERLAEYPIMRKMTEAMRKADALSAALQENANG